MAERLDARRVAKVEPEDLEPVAPLREVRLLRVPRRRVTRKARGHDHPCARAQQLDPCLVADLHAAAGEEGDATAEVGALGALREVERGARRAELVVERVQLDVVLLAHVAMLWLDDLAEVGVVELLLLELAGRGEVRRREHGPLAQHANPRLRENGLVDLATLCLLLPAHALARTPARGRVGIEDVAGSGEQPRSLLDGQPLEQAPVLHDRIEELRRRPQPLGELILRRRAVPVGRVGMRPLDTRPG